MSRKHLRSPAPTSPLAATAATAAANTVSARSLDLHRKRGGETRSATETVVPIKTSAFPDGESPARLQSKEPSA